MRIVVALLGLLVLHACAAPGTDDGPRKETAIMDFIEVNEVAEVSAIRSLTQLDSRDVNDRYVIVSTRERDYLLAYYSRCTRRFDGRVEPDIRQDSRALYPRVDTFRGCRIKAIYALEPGQADEVREIGKSVGGGP